MIDRLTRRLLLLRLVRAVWRYRRQVHDHGDAYQTELATTLRTQIDAIFGGRLALGGYRLAMRVLLWTAILLALLALAAAALLWQLHPLAALLALLLAVPAAIIGWWRLAWGAPIDWLDEHADPDRRVELEELPQRLRELAVETRQLANVPGRLADELEELARRQ